MGYRVYIQIQGLIFSYNFHAGLVMSRVPQGVKRTQALRGAETTIHVHIVRNVSEKSVMNTSAVVNNSLCIQCPPRVEGEDRCLHCRNDNVSPCVSGTTIKKENAKK